MSGLRFYLFLVAFCSCSFLGRGDSTLETKLLDVLSAKKEQGLDANTVVPAPVTDATHVTVTDATHGTETDPTHGTETDPSPVPDNTASSSTTSTTNTKTTTTTPKPTPAPPKPMTTTTTTTPKPTPAPPTPTPKPPAPTPPPAPTQGTWHFTENNVTCILAQFAAQINISYPMTVNNATKYNDVIMNVPLNASVIGGSCGNLTQWLVLGWPSSANTTLNNTIVLHFLKNETTKDYALDSFNLSVDATQLVNLTHPLDRLEFTHGEEWATPLATSYRCLPATKLSMNNDTYAAIAVVTVSRLQEEAFRSTPGTGFSAPRECGGDDVPDAVPIAVGCALGGLVLVVLVAYLVARRRSAARGYLSM